jgi:hypothetical protein
MGELIPFQARRKAADSALERPAGGAEILFFLGVRYERDATPPPSEKRARADRGGRGKPKNPGKRRA